MSSKTPSYRGRHWSQRFALITKEDSLARSRVAIPVTRLRDLSANDSIGRYAANSRRRRRQVGYRNAFKFSVLVQKRNRPCRVPHNHPSIADAVQIGLRGLFEVVERGETAIAVNEAVVLSITAVVGAHDRAIIVDAPRQRLIGSGIVNIHEAAAAVPLEAILLALQACVLPNSCIKFVYTVHHCAARLGLGTSVTVEPCKMTAWPCLDAST